MASLDINTLFSVKGLVAVVTGGGTGLGLMIARALDANGAEAVYIVGRREGVLQDAAKQGTNGRIIPLVGDVTSVESLKSLVAHVQSKHGYLDILFANSGVPGTPAPVPKDHSPSAKEFGEARLEIGMDKFSNVMHVNVSGSYYTAMAFLDLLDQGNKRSGRPQKSSVVITTSLAGFMRESIAGVEYNVSKSAANHLVKILSKQLLDFDVRVNAIAPGLFPSELTDQIPVMQGADVTQDGGLSKDVVPMGRSGRDTDMAGAALFLASPAGAYLTGHILVNDGGRLTQRPSSY
ncbi:MAG: hypothetical protein M1831_000918 [Alyxoria varia]|nr:MAG: hypothetical protein M1831_000918 [Alyxoria varia]